MGPVKAGTLAITISLLGIPALSIAPSQAEPWPHRTVTFITPTAVGTATDFVARLFVNALAERWDKPIVVENRLGGDMIIGVFALIRSAISVADATPRRFSVTSR